MENGAPCPPGGIMPERVVYTLPPSETLPALEESAELLVRAAKALGRDTTELGGVRPRRISFDRAPWQATLARRA